MGKLLIALIFIVLAFNVSAISQSDVDKLKNLERCENGTVGDLLIDIEDPDNGDEFSIGDVIDVEVEIDNKGDDEIDVDVDVFLFNTDEDDDENQEKRLDIEIDEDEDETVFVPIEVPKHVEEKDDYIIFVKVAEERNELAHCAEDFVEVEMEIEDDDVILENVKVVPSTAMCGDEVVLEAEARNIGNDPTDVTVRIESRSLGLFEEAGPITLQEADEEGESVIRRFTFNVPENAEERIYSINVEADIGSDVDSKSVPLRVEGCGEFILRSVRTLGDLEMIVEHETKVRKGLVEMQVRINNNGDDRRVMLLGLENVDDWADIGQDERVILMPNQGSTIFLYARPKADAEGKQSATIVLKDGLEVLASETFTVDLGGEVQGKSSGKASIVTIIIVVIILGIYLWMRKKKY